MRNLLLTLLLMTAGVASGQVGITGLYNSYGPSYKNVNADPADLAAGPEVALNYWFRLRKYRVEFLPTVYYARGGDEGRYDAYGLQFKTNVYLFDLGTDCDCPTFGKQGPQLEKGFFLQLAPGLESRAFADADRNLSPTLGAALGVDFGLSNLLTLTPIAGLRYATRSFDALLPPPTDDLPARDDWRAGLWTYQLGLQATFRLDKRRY